MIEFIILVSAISVCLWWRDRHPIGASSTSTVRDTKTLVVNRRGEKVGYMRNNLLYSTEIYSDGIGRGYAIDGKAHFCAPVDGRINGHLREENGVLVLTD